MRSFYGAGEQGEKFRLHGQTCRILRVIPMKNILLKSLVPLLFLLLLQSTAVGAGWMKSPAPDFTLEDKDGKSVSLSSYKGRVVFIDFWASWCAPCKKEFPELNSFMARYDPSDVVALAVNIDKKRAHADDFLKKVGGLNKNLIVLYDPASTVIPLYKARAMPTSFIIDSDGLIRHVHFGYNKNDPEKWIKEVDALLSESKKSAGSK